MTDEQKLYFLQCLDCAGVDNWDGIDYAHEMYLEKYPEEDES